MRRSHRLWAGTVAVVVGLGAAVLTGPTASANPSWSIETDCSKDLVLSSAAQPGDEVIVTLLPACGSGGVVANMNGRVLPSYTSLAGFSAGFLAIPSSIVNSAFSGAQAFGVPGDDWFAYGSGNANPTVITTSLLAVDGAGNPLTLGSVVATLDPEGYGRFAVTYGALPTTASTPIPPWVQSYGRESADAPCDSGWGRSWEMWPHGGTGGYVCTREVPSLG